MFSGDLPGYSSNQGRGALIAPNRANKSTSRKRL
nr:MAG TPA: hypothetical protein [Caudoviricetes sp.]